MTTIDTLKRWLGLGAKPEPSPKPTDTKTVSLPNGRTALVDELGNFIRFHDKNPSNG